MKNLTLSQGNIDTLKSRCGTHSFIQQTAKILFEINQILYFSKIFGNEPLNFFLIDRILPVKIVLILFYLHFPGIS